MDFYYYTLTKEGTFPLENVRRFHLSRIEYFSPNIFVLEEIVIYVKK